MDMDPEGTRARRYSVRAWRKATGRGNECVGLGLGKEAGAGGGV